MKFVSLTQTDVDFHFAANDTAGSGGAGANEAFAVRQVGDAAGAAPIVTEQTAGASITRLTNASYPAGSYEIIIPVSGVITNPLGRYAVFTTLLIDSQNPSGYVGSFRVDPLIDQLLAWVQLLARGDAAIIADRAAELSQINADQGSGAGAFDPAVHASEPNAIAAALAEATAVPAAGASLLAKQNYLASQAINATNQRDENHPTNPNEQTLFRGDGTTPLATVLISAPDANTTRRERPT